MKKTIRTVIMCICILAGAWLVSSPGYAQENHTYQTQIEPRMTYILTYRTQLSISDTGIASVKGEVKGKSGVTSAYVKVILQKYESGKWEEVMSWEDSRRGRNAVVAVDYQVTRGTYRTVMTCNANTESKSATSASVSY